LEECLNLLKFKADEKAIELSVSTQGIFWPKTFFTDGNRLKQIVINLVSNAIKYTMKGYVKIYSEIDLINQMICIVFEDSGVGIS
jgi:signal transduction histidine kinase